MGPDGEIDPKEGYHVRGDPDFIRPLRVRIRRSHCSLHMFVSHRRSSRLITDNYFASAANMFKGNSGTGPLRLSHSHTNKTAAIRLRVRFHRPSTTVLQSTSFLS